MKKFALFGKYTGLIIPGTPVETRCKTEAAVKILGRNGYTIKEIKDWEAEIFLNKRNKGYDLYCNGEFLAHCKTLKELEKVVKEQKDKK